MKNAPNIETVDFGRHGKLKVKPNPDHVHAKGANLVPVTLIELGPCISNYPIVFIKTPEGGLRPMALLGLRPGENVYYGETGWDVTYVPRMVQVHPFVIAFDDRQEDSVVVTVCLDRTSAFINEEEGVAMFNAAGEQTDFLNYTGGILQELYESEKLTGDFIRKLGELGLFTPFDLLVQSQNGESRRITGMFGIDENKLRDLSPENMQELHRLDYLRAAYMILVSLLQMPRLLKLRNRANPDEQIVDYMTELAKPDAAKADAEKPDAATPEAAQ